MTKTQFNVSIGYNLKKDFGIKCKNECRDLSKVIEFLIQRFLDGTIIIPDHKVKK